MYKYLLIIGLIGLGFSRSPQDIFGKYTFHQKYIHFNITLLTDSTFIQHNGGCTWQYSAIGKWRIDGDTLSLSLSKLYSEPKQKKKNLVDTNSSRLTEFFYRMNTFLVKEDTLSMLYKDWKGEVRITQDLVFEQSN